MASKLELVAIVCVLFIVPLIASGARYKREDTTKNQDGHKRLEQMFNSPHMSHMSKKIMERACKASPETLEQVFSCMKSNHFDLASVCFKTVYGVEMDPKNMLQHKDLVCSHREKMDDLIACGFKEMEKMDLETMNKMADSMVDLGLCVINAFDGIE